VASCLFGWAACAILKLRKGPRDDWYARYLVTFTFTQLVDIVLWTLHSKTKPYLGNTGGLQACPDLQLSFIRFPGWTDPQFYNFYVSKFLLPCVIFSQHAMQLTYPSNIANAPGQRHNMIKWRMVPCAIMVFAFACTWLVPSPYSHTHEQKHDAQLYTSYNGTRTLHWGGDFTHGRMQEYMCLNGTGFKFSPVCLSHVPTWVAQRVSQQGYVFFTWFVIQFFACLHSGIVSLDFFRIMPRRMAICHNAVLAGVVATLAFTDGTIQLGSKWCTFCLVYSIVYVLDPLWYPYLCAADDLDEVPVKKVTSAPATESPSPSPVKVSKSVPVVLKDNGYRGTGGQIRSRGVRA
jgi:hypothetical protein